MKPTSPVLVTVAQMSPPIAMDTWGVLVFCMARYCTLLFANRTVPSVSSATMLRVPLPIATARASIRVRVRASASLHHHVFPLLSRSTYCPSVPLVSTAIILPMSAVCPASLSSIFLRDMGFFVDRTGRPCVS